MKQLWLESNFSEKVPLSENAAREFLWSHNDFTVPMVGRGFCSLQSKVPQPLLESLTPLRAKFHPFSELTSTLGSSQHGKCGRDSLATVMVSPLLRPMCL